MRGKEKVDGEYNLFALCYNLRRSMSIIGVLELVEWLKARKAGNFEDMALWCGVKPLKTRSYLNPWWGKREAVVKLGLVA